MKVGTFLIIVAVIYAIFGVIFLVSPDGFMGMNGAELNAGGNLLGRVLGASLLGFAAVFWGTRNLAATAVQPVLWGGLIYNVIDFVLSLMALTSGVVNTMGWGPIVLHAILAAGFAFYLFVKR